MTVLAKGKPTLICLAILLGLTLGAGCATTESSAASDQAKEAPAAPAPSEPMGRYYDFHDIQVPTDMSLEPERSILYKVGEFKAGLLVLTGRVKSSSLADFFLESMARDNWTLKSSFKYPRTALFFAKPGKVAIIYLTEDSFTTTAEIWVAPTL